MATQAEAAPPQNEEEEKLISIIKETKAFLESRNSGVERLLKAHPKPDVINGNMVVSRVKNSGKEKKEFAFKLNRARVPKLNRIASFLANSATDDEQEIRKGKNFFPRLQALYVRLKEELATKKIFIEDLDKYLAEFSEG